MSAYSGTIRRPRPRPATFSRGAERFAAVNMKEKAKSVAKAVGLFGDWDADQVTYSEYLKMLEDPQVKAAARLRILARLASGYEVEAASDEAVDQEIAEFVEDQLEQMTGTFSGFYTRAAMATVRKVSIHEIVYRYIEGGRWAGKVGLQALKPKRYDPENWKLITDEFGNLETLEQTFEGNKVSHDPAYFAIWVHEHEGDFVGRSDLKAAYRYWKAKDHVDKFWNVFLERNASPTPYGKYPPNTSPKDRDEVLRFLQQMNILSAVTIPEGWDLGLIEAKGTGASYKARVDYCDRMIARALLMPMLMLDEGASGSYSLGQEHADTFRLVVEDLGNTFAEEIMHEQVIKRLVSLNWQTDQFPRLRWKPLTGSAWKDQVTAMCDLVDKGIVGADEPITRERLGLPPREDAGDAPSSPEGNRRPGPATGAPPSDDPGEGGVPGTDPEQYSQAPAGAELLEHAEKVDFEAVEGGLDGIEAQLQRNLAAVFEDQRNALLEVIRKRGIGRGERDAGVVDRLRLTGVGRVRDALLAAFAYAVHLGAAHGSEEVDRGLEAAGVPERPEPGRTMRQNLAEAKPLLGPAEIDSLDDIIRFWKGKVPIQKEMLAFYEKQAFTIAGVYRDELLAGAQQRIRRGLIRGASMEQIQQEIGDLFAPYTATGEVAADVTSSARLHNIARTNVAEAYNTGRQNFFAHPEVGSFIQAYEYSAVLDERTTEFCSRWHGVVLRADDTRLRTITPPNHYQCRSLLIPVVKGEQFEVTKNVPGVQPQSGFRL